MVEKMNIPGYLCHIIFAFMVLKPKGKRTLIYVMCYTCHREMFVTNLRKSTHAEHQMATFNIWKNKSQHMHAYIYESIIPVGINAKIGIYNFILKNRIWIYHFHIAIPIHM